MWLKRVADKGRAAAAGTIHDYIYPCPMDQGVMERWGITPAQFNAALAEFKTDQDLLAWLRTRTTEANIKRANEWLVAERTENLDRQDAEEGAPVG